MTKHNSTHGVAPTQAPSAPTRLMLEAGKGALWHASCREIEPTDDEIAAVWKAMEQARTDGVSASDGKGFGVKTPIPSPMDYEGEG